MIEVQHNLLGKIPDIQSEIIFPPTLSNTQECDLKRVINIINPDISDNFYEASYEVHINQTWWRLNKICSEKSNKQNKVVEENNSSNPKD